MAIKVIRICDICETEYEQFRIKWDTSNEVSYSIDFICSTCIFEIEKLKDLESQENEGRGVTCVRYIIHHLEKADIETAKRIYVTEGDKITSYPKIQEWMYKNFGCRNCLKINCQHKLCKALKEYNDLKLRK